MEVNKQTNNRLYQVSFYKGIAILMILLCHATQKFDIPTVFHYVPKFCQMGCQMFFVLSAFCLCMSMEKRKDDTIYSFYRRRFLSIAPGYWLTVLVFVIFALLTTSGGGNFLNINLQFHNIVINLGMIHGLIPTEANNKVVKGGWYVGTLVILYFLFPLLKTYYFKINQKINGLVFILILQIFSFGILAIINYLWPSLSLKNNKFLYFSFVNQLPCFCLGIWLYDIFSKDKLSKVRYSGLKGSFMLILAFLLFFSYLTYAYIFLPTLFAVAFIYIFIFSFNKNILAEDTGLVRVLMKLGDNSYAIYLIHPIILYSGVHLLNAFYYTNLIIYFIWLPLSIIIVIIISRAYNAIISNFQNLVSYIYGSFVLHTGK